MDTNIPDGARSHNLGAGKLPDDARVLAILADYRGGIVAALVGPLDPGEFEAGIIALSYAQKELSDQDAEKEANDLSAFLADNGTAQ